MFFIIEPNDLTFLSASGMDINNLVSLPILVPVFTAAGPPARPPVNAVAANKAASSVKISPNIPKVYAELPARLVINAGAPPFDDIAIPIAFSIFAA